MIIEPDIPKAKKLTNKRMRKQSIKMIGALLLWPLVPIVLFGESAMVAFLTTLILLGSAIFFVFFFKYVGSVSLKHEKITLTQNNIHIQRYGMAQANILWSDIERIKFSDDIITIHLTPDAPHKHKTHQFHDCYTLDLSKIYSEIEQRWLGEKTIS